MNWLPRVVLALFIGLAVFGSVQHFFHLNFSTSLALAVLAALVAVLEGLKKVLEPRKLWLEISKLNREEKAAKKAAREGDRIIQVPTPNEIVEYGQSLVERTLRDRYRKTGRYPLDVEQFITDSHEDRKLDSNS